MTTISRKNVIMAFVAVSLLSSTFSMAAVTDNVANTKHNFSVTGASNVFTSNDPKATQVCSFCHTPHNAGKTRLLWNKANLNTLTVFKFYTSSDTLSNATKTGQSLPAGSPSLLCLGCHDGKTAMNILHTSSIGVDAAGAGVAGYPAGAKIISTVQGGATAPLTMPGPQINLFTGLLDPSMNLGMGATLTQGDNLTDDHPVGFSYTAAYTAKPTALFASPTDPKVRLFGSTSRVECSSCHDPHVDTSTDLTFKPFLVKSNTGSALCLSCHNK